LQNKENAPRQAELSERSYGQQLCQPANGNADCTARDLYIRGRLNNERQFIGKQFIQKEQVISSNNKKEALQDSIKRL